MDQKKTTLPHMTVFPKDLTDNFMIHVRLSGGIVHGHILDGHFDYNQWPKGANINCSQITQLLLDLCNKYPRLPIFGKDTNLYIQLDNASDNKNFTVLNYAAFLVESGLFRKVQINMMKPGHTHEDIGIEND
jgi:hypothetical protein